MNRKEMLYWLERGAPAICLSIQKWRDIREEIVERVALNVDTENSIDIEYSAGNCALCELEESCSKCMVGKAVRCNGCTKTPFMQFMAAHVKNDLPAMIDAATTEIEMLEYLYEQEQSDERLD